MIDGIDSKLREWAQSVAPKTEVVLDVPRASDEGLRIHLYLLDVENAVLSRREQPRPIELMLNYLVTVSGPDAAEAHRVFGTLLLAALSHPEYRAELRAADARLWAAFGVPPRPAFFFQCPLIVSNPVEIARVRHPPELRLTQKPRTDTPAVPRFVPKET